jgi:hypothetical protein
MFWKVGVLVKFTEIDKALVYELGCAVLLTVRKDST